MNHEKHDEPKGKKHTNFCNENEEDKPKIGAVHCAQMCRKYIPNGKMGYPKRQNGTSQMGFWGMRKRGSRHQNKSAEVEFWGVEGREMGFIGLVTRPKLGETGKKYNPFCNFSAWKTASYSGRKHGKPHSNPLFRHCIEH